MGLGLVNSHRHVRSISQLLTKSMGCFCCSFAWRQHDPNFHSSFSRAVHGGPRYHIVRLILVYSVFGISTLDFCVSPKPHEP
jgi:hypothetical protein